MTRRFGIVALLATVLLAVGLPSSSALAQDPCRSEHDARAAFGRCAGETFDFDAFGPYRDDVPRPADVLGYPIGTWNTTYGRAEAYVEALVEAAPERVAHRPFGHSVEQQTLHLLAIGSASTIERLDAIRADLQRLADPRETSAAEARELAADLPVVVWINSANDGNETAAFESVIQLAYQLAAGNDDRTQRIRQEVLTLINLAHNPESHERFVAWYNAFGSGDATPQALEHDAPWGMNTNNNHYQIDLNRDGFGLTQTESRAVAAEMQRWRPQVFVDLHGQTTQYFFPPNADPINPLFPEQLTTWIDTIGRANAQAFDGYGWSYYTRDVFDLHYPGYWDSYPSLHGATGMTYETDGGGGKGLRWRRDDGTILTFEDGIAHHFVASMATLDAAARNREARLRDYHAFFDSAVAEAEEAEHQAAVLLPGNDPRTAARVATTLMRSGIEVQQVARGQTVRGYDVRTDRTVSRTVPAGAYLVSFRQPNARLARMLLQPDVPLPEDFRQQELARLARNLRLAPGEREGYTFYDVTAWNLAMAAGVEALWTSAPDPFPADPLSLADSLHAAPGGWDGDVGAFGPEGGTSGRAQSAYVWSPGSIGSTRLLARLLGEGYAVAVVERPMMAGDRSFPRGSYIARVGRNPASLHDRIAALAGDAGVEVFAAATAFPERGPTGTGSETTRSLRAPRIAVLAGEGVSTTSYGALWFTLQEQIAQPFTALRLERLSAPLLADYDVLVMPDGRYGALTDAAVRDLKGWMERGGTLLAYAGGAQVAADRGLAPTAPDTSTHSPDTLANIRQAVDAEVTTDVALPPVPSPSATVPELPVPGAFLRARVDTTHWLTYGWTGDSDRATLLARHRPLPLSTQGASPVTYAAEDLVVSGFAWPVLTERTYGGQAYATVDRVGRGRVVRLAEDPVFRVWADAPIHLLTNTLFLGSRPGRGSSY